MKNIQTITPRWLKPLDAVRYSGLSIATIRRHIAAKSFASSLVGRVRLIDRISLDAFIEGSGDEMISLKMNEGKGDSR